MPRVSHKMALIQPPKSKAAFSLVLSPDGGPLGPSVDAVPFSICLLPGWLSMEEPKVVSFESGCPYWESSGGCAWGLGPVGTMRHKLRPLPGGRWHFAEMKGKPRAGEHRRENGLGPSGYWGNGSC